MAAKLMELVLREIHICVLDDMNEALLVEINKDDISYSLKQL